jgi:hypothetical protein
VLILISVLVLLDLYEYWHSVSVILYYFTRKTPKLRSEGERGERESEREREREKRERGRGIPAMLPHRLYCR